MQQEKREDPAVLLGRTPLYVGAGPAELAEALAAAHSVRVLKGEFLFHQGEPAEAFYVITEGQARLSQLTPEGHQVTIQYVGPGDAIGIIVVISGMTYPLAAEAVSDCEALRWDAESTVRLMERFPILALNGLRLVANRFHDLQDRYRELATERVERRVARALLRLARQTGKRTAEGVLLDLPLSRQDLGEMTGTTLYTVSRILSAWEQEGLILSGRERIVIRQPHGLVTIAEDLPGPTGPDDA